jgi:hypothetical protein
MRTFKVSLEGLIIASLIAGAFCWIIVLFIGQIGTGLALMALAVAADRWYLKKKNRLDKSVVTHRRHHG